MRKPTFEEIAHVAFSLFFLRLLASPVISPTAAWVLVLLTALLAGVEGLRIVSDRSRVSDLGEEVKTLQNKVASLSMAVGLSVRK